MTNELSLFIRLYLDEDVHKRVASALRLRAFDVISVHEVEQRGLTDQAQLIYAVDTQRTLFTFNSADYLKLHMAWLNQGQEHFGIIVSDQLPIGETTRRLLNLLNRFTADEMKNQLLWLSDFK